MVASNILTQYNSTSAATEVQTEEVSLSSLAADIRINHTERDFGFD